jgi:branched-chain amino acid transport system ATP-binding protein
VVLSPDRADADDILVCEGLAKRFGGLEAVRAVDLRVARGQIFGIAGPNGAGKTTLFNLISGHTAVSAGRVRFRGQDVTAVPADARFRIGLARTFQAPLVFGSESVLDNALVGAHFGRPHRAWSLRLAGSVRDHAQAALEAVGLGDKRHASAGTLSVFDRKRLMIASALAGDPAVLMLDEPVGGLNASEMEQLEGIVRTVNAAGVTVIIIEHVLKALFALSHRVLVMQHGAMIFEGTPDEVVRDDGVIRSYLGTAGGVDR